MIENIRSKEILTPRDYYSQPEVAKAVYQYLGVEKSDLPSLIDSNRLNIIKILQGVASEYLNITNLEIKQQKIGGTPARSIKPQYLPDVIKRQPLTEIFQSSWQIDAPGSENIPFEERRPIRTLMVFDIEYFHKSLPGKVFTDQQGVFQLLEPTYQVIAKKLFEYGISYMAVMTGKGYNFITQIPYTSKVMDEVIQIGKHIEKPIRDRQSIIPEGSKRDRPVPPKAQQAHKGSALLGHFLVAELIREARRSSRIPVEVSDIGEEGVAVDLTTSLLRSIDTSGIGTLGSIYVKPLLNEEHFGPEIVRGSRLLLRIPRTINSEEVRSLEHLISTRQSFSKSIKLLQETGGTIPDGSSGIQKLIEKYQLSKIKKLNDALDSEQGDPPDRWEGTYRNYNAIAGSNKNLSYALMNANEEMLKPEVLNYVLNTLYDQWGGNNNIRIAGHVRTFLRSLYEDPRFNWGSRFLRHYSAEQHATGWTTIILGQRFEED